MNILLSGSTGLVGTAVRSALGDAGHRVVCLVRRPPQSDAEVSWDPARGEIQADRLGDLDAVVHLAGENIAARRWTAEQKARIRDSRVAGTRLLCDALAAQSTPPQVFVGASAIGYYGDRGDAVMTETSTPGDDFLAETCVAWEAASDDLARGGTRVVRLRIGVVLSPHGGLLHRILPIFRLGMGGVLGPGTQYFSWIALDDVVGAVLAALADDRLSGPANATAPHPVTNREFTATLGRVLRRPTLVPVPAFGLRMLMGEMGETLALASTRVVPRKLLDHDFAFRFSHLEEALRHLLQRPA